jgi:large subunit ribosomal protein L21
MYAIISHNGTQYRVEPEKEYKIDLVATDEKKITFSSVLLVADDKETKIGTPYVEGASVEAEVLGLARGPKLTAIKFKPKKHYKRNLGHRQDYTLVKVSAIKL